MTPADDRITLRGMRFSGRHGVHPEEKLTPQPFEVDLVLHADLSRPAASDALAETADYGPLFGIVRDVVTGDRSFDLVEGLAGAIADAALAATDPALVVAVEVRVRKPQAPLPGAFDTVEVSLLRKR